MKKILFVLLMILPISVSADSVRPVFIVDKNNVSQTIPSVGGTYDLTWSSVTAQNPTGDFDFVNNRFLPKLAGYYSFSGSMFCSGLTVTSCGVALFKNATTSISNRIAESFYPTLIGTGAVPIAVATVYLNGVSDYVSMSAVNISGVSYTADGTPGLTEFYGYYLSPLAGSSSDTVDNPIADIFMGMIVFFIAMLIPMWWFKRPKK